MASLEELRSERLKKIEKIKEKGINPYPTETRQTFTIEKALNEFEALAESTKEQWLAGRVMAIRGQGSLVFSDLDDGTGRMQLVIKEDELGEEPLSFFKEVIDIGDFIEARGTFFVTQRGEKSLLVKEWGILAKSLRPLPDKWHGLQDVEERFRKRYLDSLMSAEVKERFLIRSRLIKEIRSFLDEEGYVEVETPVLQHLAGGATALPFITHHNALDLDLYLRIAPELYLKKMLVGGFPKVYELSRNFRNEGIDATHNPEFTMLEFYEAFSDAEKQRVFVEKLMRRVVERVFGKTGFEQEGTFIDFQKPFAVKPYLELLEENTSLKNILSLSREEVANEAKKLGLGVEEADTKVKILDNIYKKVCRPKLIQPTFLVDYPVEYLPLAKRKTEEPELVDAFQLVVAGVELVKAFSELNDPIDQRGRFMEQEKNRERGDTEAQPSDEDFLETMEYGMPPAGGVGIGIDRLTMVLTNTANIKEVIFFPLMRPKE